MCRAFTLGCLCLWMCSFGLRAQVSLDWTSRYSGPTNAQDVPRAITLDPLGSSYVTGTSGEGHVPDIVTIKYNSSGGRVWTTTWGTPGVTDYPTDIELDPGGNVFVYGSALATNQQELVLIKHNTSGNREWVRHFSRATNNYPSQMTIDDAGNVYLTGTAVQAQSSEFLTIKYDSGGNVVWSRAYLVNGIMSAGDFSGDVAVNESGDVYVTGVYYAQNAFSTFTLKYDSDGTFLWSAAYPSRTYAQRIELDPFGNVYVGASGRSTGASDLLVLKYDPSGALLWTGTYRSPSAFDDNLSDIAVDASGNVYLTGISSGFASHDAVTVKFNADGVKQWISRYNNHLANSSDFARAVAVDSAGSVYVGGYTHSGSSQHDFLALKYDANGNQKWAFMHDQGGGPDFLLDFALAPSGDVFLTGSSMYLDTGADILTLQLGQTPIAGLPEILSAPQDVEVISGESDVTFSVTVESATPVSYQWRRNGRDIPGATLQSYTVTSPDPSEAGEYSVRVSNVVGVTATPEARLTVRRPPVVQIYTQPQNVVEGGTVVLDAFVDGDPPMRVQWRFNDMDLIGQTNLQLRLIAVQS